MLCSMEPCMHWLPGPDSFRMSLPATAEAVAETLERVGIVLLRRGIEGGLRDDVTITLGEVLNNVVEHACVDIADGEIDLRGKVSDNELCIEVCDPGRPFAGGTLPEGREVNVALPVDLLPEGGFGWFLIRSLTSGIDYRREQDRNCLTLRFAR